MRLHNLVFSILFLIFCFLQFLVFCWGDSDGFTTEKAILIFLSGIVILATICNVLAFALKRSYLYLIGMLGFVLFCVCQCLLIFMLIISNMGFKHAYSDLFRYNNPAVFAISMPLGIYGLLSTLFCYQKNYKNSVNQESNEFIRSCNRCLFRFCFTDYKNVIDVFNISTICLVILFTGVIYAESRGQIWTLAILIFCIPSILNLTGSLFKIKKFYIASIIVFSLYASILIVLLVVTVYKIIENFHHVYWFAVFDFFFLFAYPILLNMFIAIIATANICREKKNLSEEIERLIEYESQSTESCE